jgi:hypothetical protein
MKYSIGLACLLLCLAMPVYATQIIQPTTTATNVSGGSVIVFKPVYTVASPDNGAETGLGLRVHFNASALQFKGVKSAFAYGLQPVGEVSVDSANLDADSSTDRYLTLAWVDVTAQWPGADELPLTLGEVSFEVMQGFTGTTHIRTTASDTADGIALQSTPMKVTVEAITESVTLKLRGMLQGAYVSADARMRDSLRINAWIPLTQPYAAWGHGGSETTSTALLATSGDDAIVDWVLVELRAPQQPQTRLASQAALLQRDGDVVGALTGSPTLAFQVAPGDYYVALRHRNHLGVMSAAPLKLTASPSTLDFTYSTTPVYGNDVRISQASMRLLPTGDANSDLKLIADGPSNDKNTVLSIILASLENTGAHTNFQLPGYRVTDMNLDGKTLYVGPDNDLNALLGNILLAPGNSTNSTNYILLGSLPQ